MLIFQKHVTIETRWHNIPRTIQSHEIDNARSNYTTVYYTDTYSNIMWIQTHWKRGDLEEHWQNSVITYSTAPLWEKAKTGKKKKNLKQKLASWCLSTKSAFLTRWNSQTEFLNRWKEVSTCFSEGRWGKQWEEGKEIPLLNRTSGNWFFGEEGIYAANSMRVENDWIKRSLALGPTFFF